MKNSYILATLVCILILSSSHEVRAQTQNRIDSEARVEVRGLDSIGAKIRTVIDRDTDRLKSEQEMRQNNRLATSSVRTRVDSNRMNDDKYPERSEVRERDENSMWKNASSSKENMEEQRSIRKNLRLDEFKNKQKRIVSQLERAINNLKQIRGRLVSRIEKAESSGRNMAEARSLIIIADSKIDLAIREIAILTAHEPTTIDQSATSTTNIDLTKPRQISESAVRAIKDARRALVDVVISIAHNMGIKCNRDNDSVRCIATTTSETISTTTTP